MVQISINNVSFKVHKATNTVNVFVYNPNFAKGDTGSKTVRKALKFFWGTDYRLQTDIAFWDSAKQRFFEVYKKQAITTAPKDYKRLNQLYEALKTVLDTVPCYSPEDLFNAYKASLNIEATSVQTVLGYTIYYRNMWLSGNCKKHKSGNYEVYNKLIHKLQGTFRGNKMPWANEAKQFANMPIDKVDTEVFKKWCKFVAANNLGYKDSVKCFRSTVYHYQRVEKGNLSFRFLYSVGIDNPKGEAIKKHEVFTDSQINRLFNFDVSLIRPQISTANKQLYIDTCILMYGLCSRPVDVLSMKIEDIKKGRTENKYIWNYCPIKMVNRNFKKESNRYYGVPVSDMCLAIIKKYVKGRKSGFVLPFKCNETEEDFITRKHQTNHIANKIGKFLQDIAVFYNWDIKPTMYSLRHTVITNLAKQNISIDDIAIIGKTSRKMIEATYMSKEDKAVTINTNVAFNGININM